MKNFFKVSFIISIISVSLIFAEEKIKIAIMNFKSESSDGATISDIVKNEFLKIGAFEIAERESIDKILKEQQIQMSGLIDTSQAVEIGKLTAAKKLIMGSIGTVGDQIVITVRVVDVESGKIEIGDKQTAYSTSDIIPVVEELSRRIASKIIGKEIEVSGKRYFATSISFSEMKVLYIADKDVTISCGENDNLNPGDKLLVYIVKPNGKEQRKALIKVKKVKSEQAECKQIKKLEGMITATDLVRKISPDESY